MTSSVLRKLNRFKKGPVNGPFFYALKAANVTLKTLSELSRRSEKVYLCCGCVDAG